MTKRTLTHRTIEIPKVRSSESRYYSVYRHGVDMQEHLLSGTHCAEILTIPQKINLCATKHASCGVCLSNFVVCVDTLILSKIRQNGPPSQPKRSPLYVLTIT